MDRHDSRRDLRLLFVVVSMLLPLTAAQFSIGFGIPQFGGGGGGQSNNPHGGRQDNLGNLVGNVISGFLGQLGRPNNSNNNNNNPNPGGNNNPNPGGNNNPNPGGNNNQGGRPGGRPVGGINLGNLPISVTQGEHGNLHLSFGNRRCDRNNGNCQHGCRMVRGRAECFCNSGFFLLPNGLSCGDVNECFNNNGGCQQQCINSQGSFTCRCGRRQQLASDGKTCEGRQRKRCHINNGGCEQICQNRGRRGVTCSCNPGFVLNDDQETCSGIDLCVNNNGGCQETCSAANGQIVCSCGPGKALLSDRRSCGDLDECRQNNGGCEHQCINTPGSFQCQCFNGFTLVDGRRCQRLPPSTSAPIITQRPTTPRPTPRPTTRPTSTDPPLPSQGCGVNGKKSLFRRIVGGKPADPKDWPWMGAILKSRGDTQFCGCTLITDRHVLTAAHCVVRFQASDMKVRLGEYNFDSATENSPSDFQIVDVRVHENYNTQTQENDIAIMKLDRPTNFNEFIWPVCLPPAGASFENAMGYVTGWGTIYFGGPVSSVLQEVIVPVWNQNDCNNAYPGRVTSTMMCAGLKEGGKDSCQGDSGGPFLVQDAKTLRWIIAGVVSWGIECAKAENPGVYTRVPSYLNWITTNAIF